LLFGIFGTFFLFGTGEIITPMSTLVELSLDTESIQDSCGVNAASKFDRIVEVLLSEDDSTDAGFRYSIVVALLEWQQVATSTTQHQVFKEHLHLLVSLISKCVMYENDGSYSTAAVETILGKIHVGNKVCQLIEKRLSDPESDIPDGFIGAVTNLLRTFVEKVPDWTGNESGVSAEAESEMKNVLADRLDLINAVLRCIPSEGSNP
jgi:hypothetical protein